MGMLKRLSRLTLCQKCGEPTTVVGAYRCGDCSTRNYIKSKCNSLSSTDDCNLAPAELTGVNEGLPPTPTDAEPGSTRKIDILRERARMGYALHHPDDRKHIVSQSYLKTLEEICRSHLNDE